MLLKQQKSKDSGKEVTKSSMREELVLDNNKVQAGKERNVERNYDEKLHVSSPVLLLMMDSSFTSQLSSPFLPFIVSVRSLSQSTDPDLS